MVAVSSRRTSSMMNVVAASRQLGKSRWMVAAAFFGAGILAASLIGQASSPSLSPARLAIVAADGTSTTNTASEVAAELQARLTAPNMLRRTQYELNLAALDLSSEPSAEALLASAIRVAPSALPSVIDIAVDTGHIRVDGMIANYLAGTLVAPPAQAADASAAKSSDQAGAEAKAANSAPVHFKFVANARVNPARSMWLYQAEVLILSTLLSLAVIALGLARQMRPRVQPMKVAVTPKPVAPRGILEQIDMLERMWPETGRTNPLPESSNDEPAQESLLPARKIVLRMGELRQEAREAIEGPSEEALENVLTDMQSLRDHVRWITAEQLRQRRQGTK